MIFIRCSITKNTAVSLEIFSVLSGSIARPTRHLLNRLMMTFQRQSEKMMFHRMSYRLMRDIPTPKRGPDVSSHSRAKTFPKITILEKKKSLRVCTFNGKPNSPKIQVF